jgi:hypothetical protein
MWERARRMGNRGRVSIRDRSGRYLRRLQLLGLWEIAMLMIPGGTEKEIARRARLLAAWLSRRNGSIPEPDAHLASGPVWRRYRIERWIRQRQGGPTRNPAEEAAAAVRQELVALQNQAERLARVLEYLESRAMRERNRQSRSKAS